MNLYIVYLGGKLLEGRVGEDHEVVVVIEENETKARKAAKKKWRGVGDPHVDSVMHVETIDGYDIELVKSRHSDLIDINDSYST